MFLVPSPVVADFFSKTTGPVIRSEKDATMNLSECVYHERQLSAIVQDENTVLQLNNDVPYYLALAILVAENGLD